MSEISEKVWKAALEGLPEDPIIVEVGACVGKGVRRFLKARPKAEIHAIEPSPSNAKRIPKADNVWIHNLAIGKQNGSCVIFTQPERESHSAYRSVAKYKGGKIRAYNVEMRTLMDFIHGYLCGDANLLRLDCYGSEYDIFEGPLEWLEWTNAVMLTLHSKPHPFNTGKYQRKRIKIVEILSEKFELVAGRKDVTTNRKHICQLWRRK